MTSHLLLSDTQIVNRELELHNLLGMGYLTADRKQVLSRELEQLRFERSIRDKKKEKKSRKR